MGKIWQILINLWQLLFPPGVGPSSSSRQDQFQGVGHADSAVEGRPSIGEGVLVLIGPRDNPKWLRFRCPCGCGEELALNLMRSHHPCWTATLHDLDGTMSVSPSVDSTSCGAHFWIRHNRVDWCD